MRIFTMTALSAAALSLAACGGSSVDGDPSAVNLPTKYDSLEGLIAAGEAGTLDQASATMMTGTATMSGAYGIGDIGENEDLEALGDMSLTADFTGGTVTGTVENAALYNQDTQALDTTLTGSLAISGTITGTGMTASATGVLNDGDNHTLDTTMDGAFYDYEGTLAVYGDVTGTIDGEYHEGGFAATKD